MSLGGRLNQGYKFNNKYLKRIIDWWTRHYYGCDIPCSIKMGANVQFGHSGLATVISPYSRIGSNIYIQHGVTMGASKGIENAPIIEDRVIIGAHATLIGKITIGGNSVIGAGAIVTKDVPCNSIVVGINQVKTMNDDMQKALDTFCK